MAVTFLWNMVRVKCVGSSENHLNCLLQNGENRNYLDVMFKRPHKVYNPLIKWWPKRAAESLRRTLFERGESNGDLRTVEASYLRSVFCADNENQQTPTETFRCWGKAQNEPFYEIDRFKKAFFEKTVRRVWKGNLESDAIKRKAVQ